MYGLIRIFDKVKACGNIRGLESFHWSGKPKYLQRTKLAPNLWPLYQPSSHICPSW